MDWFKKIVNIPTEADIKAAQDAKAKLDQAKAAAKAAKAEKAAAKAEKAALELADISSFASQKKIATENGEPWVQVTNVIIDPDHIGDGSFTLDWNDIFVAKLIRAGFKGKVDSDIVDQWFKSICANVVAENFEQDMADPVKRADFNRKDIGNGRTEVS